MNAIIEIVRYSKIKYHTVIEMYVLNIKILTSATLLSGWATGLLRKGFADVSDQTDQTTRQLLHDFGAEKGRKEKESQWPTQP